MFTRLHEEARRAINAHGIGSIVYCVEAKSRSAHNMLRHWNIADIERSEYRMAIDRARVGQGLDGAEDASYTAKRFTRDNSADYIAISKQAYGDESDAYVDTIITSDTRLGYIVYRNNAPIGVFVIGLEEPGEPCIYGVAIAKVERGKGYGKRLIALACEVGIRYGETIQLDVDSSNPVALRLYRGTGFHITYQVDYYIGRSVRI